MLKTKRLLLLIILSISWGILYINLQTLADFIVNKIFQLEEGQHLTESIRFFIFEVPKVLLLLVLIIFIVGIAIGAGAHGFVPMRVLNAKFSTKGFCFSK